MRIKTKIMETRPHDVARDEWRTIQRGAMTAAGEHWVREMLPNHFTPQAKYIYHHKPRSKKYKRNKERLARLGKVIMGGVVDNVATGEMMRSVLSRAIIRGFPTRCTIYLHGPGYLKINFRQSTNQPNKPEEIRTVTAQELSVLKRVVRDYVRKRLTSYRSKRKETTV